jgi:DNA-binding NarL/FixJ family response regulator
MTEIPIGRGLPRLTAREREVLALVVDGYQNKEIAARLHVSLSTARFHVSKLLRKHGVQGRRELACLVCLEREQ